MATINIIIYIGFFIGNS